MLQNHRIQFPSYEEKLIIFNRQHNLINNLSGLLDYQLPSRKLH